MTFLTVLSGCGSSDNGAVISGKVTYRGQPVTGGTLKLYSDAAPSAPGADNSFHVNIKPDGTFSAAKVPTGLMKVAIDTSWLKPTGPTIDPATGMPAGMKPPPNYDPNQMKSAPAGGAADAPKYVAIPPRYADPKTSGLEWDLKPGSEKKDFDLVD